MNIEEALYKMKAPNERRGPNFGVMQILITTRCDLGNCSNCTQMIPYRKKQDMCLRNFEKALKSVRNYPGIIGIMGGNPCLHKKFREISKIFSNIIPDKKRRGLWTNNINGHGELIQEIYGYFNFNVHGNHKHAKEIIKHIPDARVWGLNVPSLHGGVLVDMSDVVKREEDRWKLIAECDINQKWSPAMAEIDGQLVGYLCEVMAAMEQVRFNTSRKNCGFLVEKEPNWWKHPMKKYKKQVETFCHHCGVPMRIKGFY
ncbi:MAG TPA: hypothetical protein DDX98_13885, partial [Bacteroidales bacterium]|nr:hypothetical protein [Bacteroidales bacterium]